MSPRLFLFAFPDGTTEYRTSHAPPTPGEVLTRLEEDFTVHHVGKDSNGTMIVTLRKRPPPRPET
jgi:hypothetical protein